MPRPNYGPQSQKRTKCLLEVLITYANGEFEECDRFESQIQVNWQTEKQLVIRTKVRYLEALIAETGTKEKLNCTQLKDSLKRLKDFLEILEDNRCSTQGSDSWHFTLKLWHHRLDLPGNLVEFDRQWEQRRSPKSKQSTREVTRTQTTEILPNNNISINQVSSRQDWGEAPNCVEFYDRQTELSTLTNWILEQRCQLVTVLGMGGMGKTALSVKLTQQIQGEFSGLIWRSLRNAPPLEKLLTELIKFVSNEQLTQLPQTVDEQISTLIQYLQNSRFLLILDNVESILDSNKRVGSYRDSYERYGQLFRSIGETQHQSCLLLTSR